MDSPALASDLVWATLVASAIVLGLAAVAVCQNGYSLRARLGAPEWDFSQSWASTLTGIGVIIDAIFQAQLAPGKTLPKETLGSVAVLFALLVVIAPFAYNVVRSPVLTHPDPDHPDVESYQLQGYVGMFLVAGALTLWGALGQIVTIVLLLDEIRLAGYLADPVVRLFQAILLVLLPALLVYAGRTAYWTVQEQAKVTDGRRAILARVKGLDPDALTAEQHAATSPALPPWSLL